MIAGIKRFPCFLTKKKRLGKIRVVFAFYLTNSAPGRREPCGITTSEIPGI